MHHEANPDSPPVLPPCFGALPNSGPGRPSSRAGARAEHTRRAHHSGTLGRLALLTQALDRPETDIVETLHQLAGDARLAVRSYLGMSLITIGDVPFTVTALEDHAKPDDVRSSLVMPLPHSGTGNAGSTLILYAAQPGAFVDLAGDLSWRTGVEPSEYALDQDLSMIGHPATQPTVHATSVINQAIGVLIERGHLPDQAHERLNAQAADAGTDRYGAAAHILNTPPTIPTRR